MSTNKPLVERLLNTRNNVFRYYHKERNINMLYHYDRYWGIFTRPSVSSAVDNIVGYGYSGHQDTLNDIHNRTYKASDHCQQVHMSYHVSMTILNVESIHASFSHKQQTKCTVALDF